VSWNTSINGYTVPLPLPITSLWKTNQAGTGQATLEVICSKRSYALKWCKLNTDDDDDDDDRCHLQYCYYNLSFCLIYLAYFLPRDASAERGYEIACRPSVRLSVRP